MSIDVAPDPYLPDAVAFAEELVTRGAVMRVRRGTVIQVSPGRPNRVGAPPTAYEGTAVAITPLNDEERAWLVEYRRASDRKRRADRERARQERRGQRGAS